MEIEEYRKVSAEFYGFLNKGGEMIDWKPDQDYNQMMALVDKLIEENTLVTLIYRNDRAIIREWECGIIPKEKRSWYCYDESILTAFADAFMQHINH